MFSLSGIRGDVMGVSLGQNVVHLISFKHFLCCAACRILVSQPGMEPRTHQLKHRVLISGVPGNSHRFNVFKYYACKKNPLRVGKGS